MFKIFAFLFPLLLSFPLLGGDGLSDRNTTKIGIKTTFGSVSSAYDHTKKKYEIPDFTFSKTELKLQFSASPDFSFRAAIPFLVNYRHRQFNNSGIGDCSVGIDYFTKPNEKIPVIFSVDMVLPTGKGSNLNDPIPISTQELIFFYQIAVPYSWGNKLNGLTSVGYQSREEPNNSAFNAFSRLDFSVLPHIKLLGELNVLSPIGKINTTPVIISGSANGVSYISGLVGFELMIGSDLQFAYGYLSAFTAANTAILPNHQLEISYLFNN